MIEALMIFIKEVREAAKNKDFAAIEKACENAEKNLGIVHERLLVQIKKTK